MTRTQTLDTARGRQEGFTLIESLVSLFLFLVVLLLSVTLLFSMKSFAERQQLFAQPRQSARRAVDFIAYHARGATDLNAEGGNPNCLVMWYDQSGNDRQATYNNLTGGEPLNAAVDATTTLFGDVATDLITMAVPNQNLLIPVESWPGWQHAANLRFRYGDGCPDSALNLQMFKQVTGYDPATGMSPVLMLVGSDGSWGYYQITNYQDVVNANCCDSNPPEIKVINNPGQSDGVNPPGGQPDLKDPALSAVRFCAFRVKGGVLQQRPGVFDPSNPDNGFVTLLNNVEDLQIAYIFEDGSIWNTSAQSFFPDGNVPDGVPDQAGPMGGAVGNGPQDVINVRGLRITIVTRSPREIPRQTADRHARPAVEDRPGATTGEADNFYRYRLTSTVMIRNRTLGS